MWDTLTLTELQTNSGMALAMIYLGVRVRSPVVVSSYTEISNTYIHYVVLQMYPWINGLRIYMHHTHTNTPMHTLKHINAHT